MSQSRNSALSVSELSYPLPTWRYQLLFQSWTQLQSYLLIVLASTLAIHGLALVSNTRVMPIGYLLAGLALGGLMSVVMVMRARFTVSPASEAAVRRVVTEVEAARYVEDGVVGNAVMYRQNLPRVLRWDEGRISVAREGDTLILTGPVVNLKLLRKRLVA
jgi:hypothetical protein